MLSKRSLRPLLAVLASSCLSLIGLEGALRMLGRSPVPAPIPAEERIGRAHPVLGWEMLKGEHVFPRHSAETPRVTFRTHNDGSRFTSETTSSAGAQVLILGDSFVQGWLVSDTESFPWRLQTHLPDRHIVNFGVGGYSTYQSLLQLEQSFAEKRNISLVVYGLLQRQEERNVVASEWLETMSRLGGAEGIKIPVAEFSKGALVRGRAVGHPGWPLRHVSSVVASLEKVFLRWSRAGAMENAWPVMRDLVREMNALTSRNSVPFVVAILEAGPDALTRYEEFLADSGIHSINCANVDLTKRRVAGDWHPNAEAHALYAECVLTGLRTLGLAE